MSTCTSGPPEMQVSLVDCIYIEAVFKFLLAHEGRAGGLNSCAQREINYNLHLLWVVTSECCHVLLNVLTLKWA